MTDEEKSELIEKTVMYQSACVTMHNAEENFKDEEDSYWRIKDQYNYDTVQLIEFIRQNFLFADAGTFSETVKVPGASIITQSPKTSDEEMLKILETRCSAMLDNHRLLTKKMIKVHDQYEAAVAYDRYRLEELLDYIHEHNKKKEDEDFGQGGETNIDVLRRYLQEHARD